MVASHVDYQRCCEAAKIGLEHGNELVSFPCPKCGAVCCDPVEHTMKLQAQKSQKAQKALLASHNMDVCYVNTSGPSIHVVSGNPLAVLGCQLRGSTLFVQ